MDTVIKNESISFKKEVCSMFKRVKKFLKKFISVSIKFNEPKTDWQTTVFDLTDEEIFSYVNEALSNFSFLKLTYPFDNLNENTYLLSYLKNTHDALDILRLAMLSRARNLRSISSWNIRVMDTIEELEIIISPYDKSINNSIRESEVSVANLKFMIMKPRREEDVSFIVRHKNAIQTIIK